MSHTIPNNPAVIGSTKMLEDALLARLSDLLLPDGTLKAIKVHSFSAWQELPDIHSRFQNIEPLGVLSTPVRVTESPSQSAAMVTRLDSLCQMTFAIITASRSGETERRHWLYDASDRFREVFPNQEFITDIGRPSRQFWPPRLVREQFISVETLAAYICSFNVAIRIGRTGVY